MKSDVDLKRFVKVWNEVVDAMAVGERFGLTGKEASMLARRLRMKGVNLKQCAPGRKSNLGDIEELRRIADGANAPVRASESPTVHEEVYVSPLKPQKARAAPSGPLADCIRGFDAICVEFLGEPFAPWGGKNARAMAGCLKAAKGDVKAVLERARRMFEDPPDEWTAQNASPWLLESRWTNLAARAHVSPLDKQRARNKANHERIFGVPTPGAVGTLPPASDRTPALGGERGTGGAVV